MRQPGKITHIFRERLRQPAFRLDVGYADGNDPARLKGRLQRTGGAMPATEPT